MFIRIVQLATHTAWFWWELAWGGMQISNGSEREMNHCYIYLKGTTPLFSSRFCRRSNSCQHNVNLRLLVNLFKVHKGQQCIKLHSCAISGSGCDRRNRPPILRLLSSLTSATCDSRTILIFICMHTWNICFLNTYPLITQFCLHFYSAVCS